MTNLVRAVRIGMVVLRDNDQDDGLREALVDGLDSGELKALAKRELDAPGTITREIVDHQMALEARVANLPG